MTSRQAILNRRLKLYLEAEEKILQGQSYTISNRTLTRADLKKVRDEIDNLLAQGADPDGGTSGVMRRTRRIVFTN